MLACSLALRRHALVPYATKPCATDPAAGLTLSRPSNGSKSSLRSYALNRKGPSRLATGKTYASGPKKKHFRSAPKPESAQSDSDEKSTSSSRKTSLPGKSSKSKSKSALSSSKDVVAPPKTTLKSVKQELANKKPGNRAHIQRDLKRVEEAKHQIRKVTGMPEPVETAPDTLQKAHAKEIYNEEFSKLNIMGPLMRAIYDLGWTHPTPIQKGTIREGIRGHNIVASAETGTGKTAAYAIPIIQRIYIRKKYEESRGIERIAAPLGVILCPTRELAEQVEDQIFELCRHIHGLRIVGLSGAMKDADVQVEELRKGVDILVATPGRLLRMLEEKVTSEDEIADSLATPPLLKEDEQAMDDDFDDGFGTLQDEDGLDEQEGTENGPSLYEQMMDLSKKPVQKKAKNKEKKDAVYSAWDRSWDQLDRNNRKTADRFKERLPTIPRDQPVKNSKIDLTHVRFFALDEVDRMLAMGMFPEVRHLFKAMPRPQGRMDPERMQIYMYTATLVPTVWELVKRFAPHHFRLDLNKAMNVSARVQQLFYAVGPRRKYALLTYLLRRKGSMRDQQVLVFCRTRQRVERLSEQLASEGFLATGIHGDQSLARRQRLVDDFRDGTTRVLVATEVMARGMDIPHLPFVVNYDLPHSPEEYVHRIGRTGRAGQAGISISFVSSEPTLIEVGKRMVQLDEETLLRQISDFLKRPLGTSKVPGPWKDVAKNSDAEDDIDSADTTQLRPVLNVKKNALKENHTAKPKTRTYEYLEGDSELTSVIPPEKDVAGKVQRVLTQLYEKKTRQVEHALKARKPVAKVVSDANTAQQSEVSLRDFKEGRYEDVMREFDTRRARKLGIIVPTDLATSLRKKRARVAKKYIRKIKAREDAEL